MMKIVPGFYQIGETRHVEGYDWIDHRIACWKYNWHIPVRREQFPHEEDIAGAFSQGVTSYSFIEKKLREIFFPIFILQFASPVNEYLATINSKSIYPEIYFDIQKELRASINILLITNNVVTNKILLEIEKPIILKFYETLQKQNLQMHSEIDFRKIFNEYMKSTNVKELFMSGQKGHVKHI